MRVHTGTPFAPPEGELTQVAQLAQFLHWLSPLVFVGKEEQRLLVSAQARTPVRADEDPEEGEPDPDATLPPGAATSPLQGP